MKDRKFRNENRLRSVAPQILSRRTILRGSLMGVGVSLGLPTLEIMLNGNGTRLANGASLPVRFGVFHWGGGIAHKYWVPSSTGTNWQPPMSLEAFGGPVKAWTTLITGYNHAGSSPGHIPARGIALSNSHDLTKCTGSCVGTYRGQNMPEPSLDALVAEQIKPSTKFPSLEVRVCNDGPYRANSSWKRGGTTYNRHEQNPATVFNRVFGGDVPARDVGILQVSTAYKKSMLDTLTAETTDLKTKLGTADRTRLESHLDGVRELEKRLQAEIEQGSSGGGNVCMKPSAIGNPTSKAERAKLHAQVLSYALACDLTRIFSFEWSANQSQERYGEVGVDKEHHDFTHGNSGTEAHGKVIKLIMDHYAYLGEQLLARKEGAGSVLDNTLVFGTSEHANAGSHNYGDHPLLLIGKAGGAWRAAGQHLRGNGGNDAPKVMFAAVKAVGANVSRVGQMGREATAPLPGLI